VFFHWSPNKLALSPNNNGKVFILDCLAGYDMSDPKDAEKIAERVLPRLQHANSAVVLSAVKVRAAARALYERRLLRGRGKRARLFCRMRAWGLRATAGC
jgi:vesicle coat complex subunit